MGQRLGPVGTIVGCGVKEGIVLGEMVGLEDGDVVGE